MCYPVCGMLHIKEPLARLEIKIAGVPVTMSYQFVFDVREIVPVTMSYQFVFDVREIVPVTMSYQFVFDVREIVPVTMSYQFVFDVREIVPVTMSYQFVFDVREIVPVTKIPQSVNLDSSCTVDDDFNSLPPESASRDSNSTANHTQ